jgi:hypothetical protein
VRNQVWFQSRQKDTRSSFRSGVSLHGHTKHSVESLGFIGKFLHEHIVLRSWIEAQMRDCKRKSGINLNFDQAYWTPPLSAERAYSLECAQIESLGLRPIVSLSDHDNIEASALLRQSQRLSDVPISVEWTVPFGKAVFHIGVHNLPPRSAPELMSVLEQCTAEAREGRIVDLLFQLREIPSLLLVFNHPVWNLAGIASGNFEAELSRFLGGAGRAFAAFELNGMRSWRENYKVIQLAARWNQILISGGDRHACEPNAILNLTNASDFPEFIDEVRNGRQSIVAMMPQYEKPLRWRFFQSFTQITKEYPEYPEGQRRWDERTFHPDASGDIVPLSELWPKGAPSFLKRIFALAQMGAQALPIETIRPKLSATTLEAFALHGDPILQAIDCPGEQFSASNTDG